MGPWTKISGVSSTKEALVELLDSGLSPFLIDFFILETDFKVANIISTFWLKF